MKCEFILFSFTLFYQILADSEDRSHRGNQMGKPWENSEGQWSPDNGQQTWGGPVGPWGSGNGRPQGHWGPGPDQGHPIPEGECRSIPQNVKSVGFTAIVADAEVSTDSLFWCDSESKIDHITQILTETSDLTCNGILASPPDSESLPLNLTFSHHKRAHMFKSGPKTEEITLKNYTIISTLSNANWNFIECGTIASGRCAGDEISGYGVYVTDNQDGCVSKKGTSGVTGVFRRITINGLCSSRCYLGRSRSTYPAINNYGFAEPEVGYDIKTEDDIEKSDGQEGTKIEKRTANVWFEHPGRQIEKRDANVWFEHPGRQIEKRDANVWFEHPGRK